MTRVGVPYAERWSAPEVDQLRLMCTAHGVVTAECSCTRYADECDFGACPAVPTELSARRRPVCVPHRDFLRRLGQ